MIIFSFFNVIVELPDETLNMLSGSTPEFLEAFDKLVSSFASFNIQIILIKAFEIALEHVRSVKLLLPLQPQGSQSTLN